MADFHPETPHAGSPAEAILRLTTGVWTTQALWAAARLGIADRLASGPKSPATLAEETGTLARPLHRVLRALASLGIFAEDAEGRFANTASSDCLRSDVPGSLRDYVIFIGQPWHLAAFGEILHSLRTGRPSIDRVVGKPIWEFFSTDAEAGRLFNAAMTGIVAETADAVRDACDFAGIRTLVDVGGGHGLLLGTVLAANRQLRGVLFDQPHVIDGARATFDRLGVLERAACVGGDFFREVPAADAYVMSHIIHDWDDERSEAILRTIHRAAEPRARLLVVETVIPTGNAFSFGKLLDLEMLCLPGGIERTEAEYRELFDRAGFRLERVLATRAPTQIIEGVKA